MANVKEAPRREELRPRRKSLGIDDLTGLDDRKAISAVKTGLDSRLLKELAERLDLRLDELALPLQMTGRTLHRRIEEGRLLLDESERLFGLIRIFALAKQTLSSEAKAVRWLKSPLPVLGGRTPLECADTQIGLRGLEDILIRIGDVVYS